MRLLSVLCLCIALLVPAFAGPMQVEKLNRGLIAVRVGSGYYLSWRLLANEPYNTGFNVYRGNTLLNSTPITGATIYTDANAAENSVYTVRAVINNVQQPASESALIISNREGNNAGYLQVNLNRPETGQHGGTYTPNDGSVGDLTGNGVYDIVLKWDPSNSQDNANNGTTDNVIIDAYTLSGTHLWRIDLGPNIRAGAHYTQFMVYDFDGCGKAEIIMKTAPGTKDGTGEFISKGPAENANHNAIYRNSNGHIVTGPEYLTVFEGATGKELATANYWPVAAPVNSWGGVGRDNGGNRVNRFNAVVAYLDGERPSVVFQRGYYERMTFAAWDWRDGKLTERWRFDSDSTGNRAYSGQGNHSLSVADVDNSGKHSIITGAAVIKYDGTGMHTTGFGHGDALHVAHMIKGNPYPQIFMPHEDGGHGILLRHANNGNTIFNHRINGDVGRGVAAHLDPAVPGFQFWSSSENSLYNMSGTRLGDSPNNGNNSSSTGNKSNNFVIWWNGDLAREVLDGDKIAKWNIQTNTGSRLLTATGTSSNNGTKSTPILTADIFGDWREEVIWRVGNDALRIYTTTMPTTHRLVTMMHDPVYRVAVAWQNSSYNQPPHPGYYIASDMDFFPPPVLNVAVVSPSSGSGSSSSSSSGSGSSSSSGSGSSSSLGSSSSSSSSVASSSSSSVSSSVNIGNGVFFENLITFDATNAASWSIKSDFSVGQKAYGDREYLTISVPEGLLGAEWISSSMETRRSISSSAIIQFEMKIDGIVHVIHENRVTTKPSWLADFTATELVASVNDNQEDRLFTVYSKEFLAGETVSMGRNSNDGTAQSLMYLVAFTNLSDVTAINKPLVAETGKPNIRLYFDGTRVQIQRTMPNGEVKAYFLNGEKL
ncbi:MAG: rhamnogalacturonan lyase [Fibromonadaceae bacterium]|nr:rhamnogalacturonan lyase [Fibromonadaceae bacterium]